MNKKKSIRPKKVKTDKTAPVAKKISSPVSTSFFNRINGTIERHRTVFEIIAFLLVLFVGFLVRVEDFADWKANPDQAIYEGEPLLTTFDGYFYLSLARDLSRGSYNKIDKKRAVPEYMTRPYPPPFISVIGAFLYKITPFSLNWIGAFLPAFLGLALAIPLYAFGRFYSGPVMGFTAALTGLLSHYYVYRSSLGWFDTDCMNVTFATGAAYCFMRFGLVQERSRYFYLAGGMIIYLLFMWWWDQTPLITTAVTMVPLFVALTVFYRPSRREGLIFVSLAGVLIFSILLWKGFDLPIKIVHSVSGAFSYISKETQGPFPNIGVTISEQVRPDFDEIVSKTSDSLWVFLISCAGLALLFYRKPKESLFLSVPLLLGCLSFLFAKRFLIFLAPITAIGAGYLAAYLWELRKKFQPMSILTIIFILIMSAPAFTKDMKKTFWPKEPPYLIQGMDVANKKTPEDSVIWAWWDHGYPLIYWADRATINDGAIHTAERSVYNAIPYTTDNFRFAANFMQFYTARGMKGMAKLYKAVGNDHARGMNILKNILSSGPQEALRLIDKAQLKSISKLDSDEKWLEFFFPDNGPPVYLFLDWRLTVTCHWWFWLGSWNIEKRDGIHPFYNPFFGMSMSEMRASNANGVNFNFKNGELVLDNKRAIVSNAKLILGNTIRSYEYHPSRKSEDVILSFELALHNKFSALEDQHISKSVFNRLFLRHQSDQRYFKPVVLNSPAFQIWEVKGDKIKR